MTEQGFRSRFYVCYLCCDLFSLKSMLVDHLVEHLQRGRYCFHCEIGVNCKQHGHHHRQHAGQTNGNLATAVTGNGHSNDINCEDLQHSSLSPPASTSTFSSLSGRNPMSKRQLREAIHWANYMIGRMRGPRMKLAGCPVCEIHTVYAEVRRTQSEDNVESLSSLRDQLRTRLHERMNQVRRHLSTDHQQLLHSSNAAQSKELFHIFSHIYYSPFKCDLCGPDHYTCTIFPDKATQHVKGSHFVKDQAEQHVKLVHFPVLVDFVNHFASFYQQNWSAADWQDCDNQSMSNMNGSLPVQSACISSSEQLVNIMEQALQNVRDKSPPQTTSPNHDFAFKSNAHFSKGDPLAMLSTPYDEMSFHKRNMFDSCDYDDNNDGNVDSSEESDDSAYVDTSFDCFKDRAHFDAMLTRKSYTIPEEWYKYTGLIQEIRIQPIGLTESTVMLPEEAEAAAAKLSTPPSPLVSVKRCSSPSANSLAASSVALGKARKSSCSLDRTRSYSSSNSFSAAAAPRTAHFATPRSLPSSPYPIERTIKNEMTSQDVERLRQLMDSKKQDRTIQAKRYYCAFCMSLFDDVHQLINCLKQDLEYFPFTCKLCDSSTVDLVAMQLHLFDQHPNESQCVYIERMNPSIEDWLNKFFKKQHYSISNPNFLFKVLDSNCASCSMTSQLEQSQTLTLTKVEKSYFDIEHIFDHLRYYPYECTLCDIKQRQTYSCPGKQARKHMKNAHGLVLSSRETAKHLRLKHRLVSLEKLIKQRIDNVYALMSDEQRALTNYDEDLHTMLQSSLQLNENGAKHLIVSSQTIPPSVTTSVAACPADVAAAVDDSSAHISSSITPSKEKEQPKMTPVSLRPLSSSTNGEESKKPERTRLMVNRSALNAMRETHSVAKLDHFSAIGLCKQSNSSLPKIVLPTTMTDANQQLLALANCFFCDKSLSSLQALLIHLSSHLDYFPIHCLHCDRRFASEFQFALHGKLHANEAKIGFGMKANFVYDRWLDQFAQVIIDLSRVDYRMIWQCMVCSELATASQRTQYHEWFFTFGPKDEEPELAVYEDACEFYSCTPNQWQTMTHVYTHLCYTPYRCLMCYELNEDTCFELLDNRCVEHLRLHTGQHICSANVDRFVDRLEIDFLDFILKEKRLFDLDYIKKKPCGKCDPTLATSTVFTIET